MLYAIDKIIFSLCLLYIISESKCEAPDKQLASKIGIISRRGVSVTDELSTVLKPVATKANHSRTTKTDAPIHSECGGIIEIRSGELAVIEYKLHENYNNNEQCIWTIRNHNYSPTELRTLQFIKTESNFELDFDYLQISSFEKNSYDGPTQSDKIGRVNGLEAVNFTGPVAFVVFSSDGSEVGMGFRIEISTEGDQQYNYEVLNYFSKEVNGSGSLQPYVDNLMATFVVSQEGAPNLYLYLSFRLDFPNRDFIRVYRVERNGSIIRYALLEYLEHLGGRWYMLNDYTSLVFILESNSSGVGDGLEFEWFDSIFGKNN